MARRASATLTGSNIASEHVATPILNMVHKIAGDKDAVACGPVTVYLNAGRDTVLSWPSVAEEKDRNRKGGEVDWFRSEIDRTQWAKDIEDEIDKLKDRPKNVVNDREMQTLRQRLSYAASVLRRTRALASKIEECSMMGFDVKLPTADALSRTVYPITVIDEKHNGLPVQLSVRDFLNLTPVKGKQATDLAITGSRRDSGAGTKGQIAKAAQPEKIVAVASNNIDYLASMFQQFAEYLDGIEEAPKGKKVKNGAEHLAKALVSRFDLKPAQLAKAA